MRTRFLAFSVVLAFSLAVASVGANALYDDFPWYTHSGTILVGQSFVQAFSVDFSASGSATVTIAWGDGAGFSFSPCCLGTFWSGSYSHQYNSAGAFTGSLTVTPDPLMCTGTACTVTTVSFIVTVVLDASGGGGGGHVVRT